MYKTVTNRGGRSWNRHGAVRKSGFEGSRGHQRHRTRQVFGTREIITRTYRSCTLKELMLKATNNKSTTKPGLSSFKSKFLTIPSFLTARSAELSKPYSFPLPDTCPLAKYTIRKMMFQGFHPCRTQHKRLPQGLHSLSRYLTERCSKVFP